jgi:hypothetical protein
MDKLHPLAVSICSLLFGEGIGFLFVSSESIVSQILRILSYFVAIIASILAIVVSIKKLQDDEQRNNKATTNKDES